VGRAEKELFEVSDKIIKSDYVAMDELLADAFDRIEELHKNKGVLRGLKTGFRDLDNKTAGFQKGDLIIIGARPAMGKTTLSQNLAYNTAEINKKGVFFKNVSCFFERHPVSLTEKILPRRRRERASERQNRRGVPNLTPPRRFSSVFEVKARTFFSANVLKINIRASR
jgi:hypothetical protein